VTKKLCSNTARNLRPSAKRVGVSLPAVGKRAGVAKDNPNGRPFTVQMDPVPDCIPPAPEQLSSRTPTNHLLLTERCRSVLTSSYYQQQLQQLSLLAAF